MFNATHSILCCVLPDLRPLQIYDVFHRLRPCTLALLELYLYTHCCRVMLSSNPESADTAPQTPQRELGLQAQRNAGQSQRGRPKKRRLQSPAPPPDPKRLYHFQFEAAASQYSSPGASSMNESTFLIPTPPTSFYGQTPSQASSSRSQQLDAEHQSQSSPYPQYSRDSVGSSQPPLPTPSHPNPSPQTPTGKNISRDIFHCGFF